MPDFTDELKLYVEQQENCGAVLDTHGLQTFRDEDGERFDRYVYSFKLTNHPDGAKQIFVWQQHASVGEKKAVYKTF